MEIPYKEKKLTNFLIMRKMLLTMATLFVACLALSAQNDFTHKVELIAKKGATKVAIGFNAKQKGVVRIDWGDGTPIQEYNAPWAGYSILADRVTHEYAAPLAKNTTITLDGENIVGLHDGERNGDGNIIGLAALDAPDLEGINMQKTKFYATSKIDLSNYGKLRTIRMNNVKEVILPTEAPNLKELNIQNNYDADLVEDDPTYARLKIDNLDLKKYTKLTTLWLSNQKIGSVDVTGLTELQFLVLARSGVRHLYGAKDLKKLKGINLMKCYLGYDEIPLKGAAATYSIYQNEYPMEGHHTGLTVDLSHLASAVNDAGETVVTEFTPWWYENLDDYDGKAIPSDLFTVENGKFTFKSEVLAGKESRDIRIYMTNAAYPGIVTSYEKYSTEDFTLEKVAEEPKTYTVTAKTDPLSKTGLPIASFTIDAKVSGQEEPIMVFDDTLVPDGAEVIVSATLNYDNQELYEFVKYTVNGEDVTHTIEGELKRPTVRFTIHKNSEVVAVYRKKSPANFVLTYSVKEGKGTISCQGKDGAIATDTKVPFGDAVKFVATPADGYEVAYWEVDGTKDARTDLEISKTFSDGETHDIKVAFKEKTVTTFTVNYSVKEGNGTLTCVTGPTGFKGEFGKEYQFVAAPAEGYELSYWEIDGKKVTGDLAKALAIKQSWSEGTTHTVQVAFSQKNAVDAVATDAVVICFEGMTLVVDGIAPDAMIQVYDAKGQMLLATKEHKIDFSSMLRGIYFVQVEGVAYKVIK